MLRLISTDTALLLEDVVYSQNGIDVVAESVGAGASFRVWQNDVLLANLWVRDGTDLDHAAEYVIDFVRRISD